MQQAMVGATPQRLLSTVRAFQRKLWWHHGLAWALRGLSLGAAVGLVLIVVALWESREPTWLQPYLVASAVALACVAAAVIRRPSPAQAARAADRQLGLEERLSTAIEIVEGRLRSPMAPRQLDDAWHAVQGRAAGSLAPPGHLRRPAFSAAMLLGLFLVSLLIAANIDPAGSPIAALRREIEERIERSGLLNPESMQLPLLEPNQADAPFGTEAPAPLLGPQTEEQLREQIARSRSQQEALSRLAEALTGTAAAREVGEQLQRGNYAQAAESLRNLGRENDQLSRQAKGELAEALRQTAEETKDLSPELSKQEDRAARALSGRDYRNTQQALERLSQGVTDASQEIVPQQELAQAWQRLQEERLGESAGQLGSGSEGELQSSEGSGDGSGASVMTEGEGESGAPTSTGGPGSSPGVYDPEGKPTRLNVVGKEVVIEGHPSGTGDSRGPSQSDSPALRLQDAEESGAQLEGIPQPTDPVRDTAERPGIPFGHMQAVHDYFQSGDESP